MSEGERASSGRSDAKDRKLFVHLVRAGSALAAFGTRLRKRGEGRRSLHRSPSLIGAAGIRPAFVSDAMGGGPATQRASSILRVNLARLFLPSLDRDPVPPTAQRIARYCNLKVTGCIIRTGICLPP